MEAPDAFYVPENPVYTIVASARDSARFTLGKTLKQGPCKHLTAISSFVNPEGEVMSWHDFGNLEGPGWAANAVGGAWELYRFGSFLGEPDSQNSALSIVDHVLECGFVSSTGFIRGYRETTTGQFCLNFKHQSDWFCPGSMAKIGFQLLLFADELEKGPRPAQMREAAQLCANGSAKTSTRRRMAGFPDAQPQTANSTASRLARRRILSGSHRQTGFISCSSRPPSPSESWRIIERNSVRVRRLLCG